MEISGNTAFYAGLSTIQTGQNRVDQALARSPTTRSSVRLPASLRSADRSSARCGSQSANGSDQQHGEMAQGKFQVELGAKVAKASDEVLGTMIDTFA
jgi:hypothetical protein